MYIISYIDGKHFYNIDNEQWFSEKNHATIFETKENALNAVQIHLGSFAKRGDFYITKL